MKVVYVAGPYTAPNAWERELNVRAEESMAMEVAKLGAMPLCPHTNTRFFDGTLTPEFWNEGTLELLRVCHAMIVLPGAEAKSTGVRREVAEAKVRDIPTFRTLGGLASWLVPEKASDPSVVSEKFVFIVNGVDVVREVMSFDVQTLEAPFKNMIASVMIETGNIERPVAGWEVRQGSGELIDVDRTVKEIAVVLGKDRRVFLSLKAGAGG